MLLGTIAGDIIGSHFERNSTKSKDFDIFLNNHFTDDTVMTIAIANALLTNTSYKDNIIHFGRKYFEVGYGGSFRAWLVGNPDIEVKPTKTWSDPSIPEFENTGESFKPYNSWGNGSAMRVSPVAFAFDTLDEVLAEAKKTADVTHNHPEGIKGAQAIAMAIYMAINDATKDEIKNSIEEKFNYDLSRKLDDIRPNYKFDVSCQGSVPESIICFLESTDYEDCIRNAISLGGDADTLAAMAGGIAEVYYGGIPELIQEKVIDILPDEFSQIIVDFNLKFKKS